MNVCDALNAYGNNIDWIVWGIIYVLGSWKMIELASALVRWAERKVK